MKTFKSFLVEAREITGSQKIKEIRTKKIRRGLRGFQNVEEIKIGQNYYLGQVDHKKRPHGYGETYNLRDNDFRQGLWESGVFIFGKEKSKGKERIVELVRMKRAKNADYYEERSPYNEWTPIPRTFEELKKKKIEMEKRGEGPDKNLDTFKTKQLEEISKAKKEIQAQRKIIQGLKEKGTPENHILMQHAIAKISKAERDIKQHEAERRR